MPYLSGERTPYPDPLARGAWTGLTVRHSRPHLTRSVLEGVGFGLRDSFTLIQEAGLGSIDQVRISGGGAKSPLWRQILADILGVELVTVNTTEGAAYGAALLAGVGFGVWSDVLQACEGTVKITGSTTPAGDNTQIYQEYYQRYRTLYPALRDEFHAIASVVQQYST
jgi:xylulokinase